MPRKRRIAKLRATELPYEQMLELLIGPKGTSLSAFASPAERRAAWLAHGDDLTQDWPTGAVLWGARNIDGETE